MTVSPTPDKAQGWVETLKQLVQLGYPGLVTLAVIVVFALYVRTTNERIAALEVRLTACEQVNRPR